LAEILFLFPQFRKQGYEGCDPWQDTLLCYTYHSPEFIKDCGSDILKYVKTTC